MEPNPSTYAGFLGTYHRLTVPLFQRSYTWKKKNIEELFIDIKENDNGYYIGALVCVQATGKDGPRLEIVDGQQRLTTLSLITLAIKNSQKSLGKSTTVQDKLLYFKDSLKKEPIPRLSFFKTNLNSYYKDLLKGTATSHNLDASQTILQRNYRIVVELLEDYIDEGGSLNNLQKKVGNLELQIIRSTDPAEIYKLFEGLNSTALPLTQVELVKNGIFYYLSQKTESADFDKATEIWYEIESEFESQENSLFNKFLRHHWIAVNGYITGSALYQEIRKKYLKKTTKAITLQYLKQLRANATLYVLLRNADNKLFKSLRTGQKEIVGYLTKIKSLGVDQIYEILLAAHNKNKNSPSSFKISNYRELVKVLWRFSFLAKYSTLNPGKYEQIFADIAHKITNSTHQNFTSKDILPKLLELQALIANREEEFVQIFTKKCLYTNSHLTILCLLQDMVEADTRKMVIKDPEVEHILPQKPKKWDLTEREIKNHVHRVGNLTILSAYENNEKAQDETMAIKVKNVYSKSSLKINTDLTRWKKVFTKDYKKAIEDRGNEIARKIYRMYTSETPRL